MLNRLPISLYIIGWLCKRKINARNIKHGNGSITSNIPLSTALGYLSISVYSRTADSSDWLSSI